MRVRYCFTLLAMLAALAPCSGQVAARDLSFEDRVKAQEATERVYYSHQVGVTRPFEEAVPRSLLEQKVRTYLKQSVALERFWNTPVTAEMLQAELKRMARETRMPERLRELFAALGNNPFLIQECLARPGLVDRLTRNFFAYDQDIHGVASEKAEALRDGLLRGRIDPEAEHPYRHVMNLVRMDHNGRDRVLQGGAYRRMGQRSNAASLDLRPEEFERWSARLPGRAGRIGSLLDDQESFTIPVVLERHSARIRLANFIVPKRSWDDWWAQVEADLNMASVRVVASNDAPVPDPLPERAGGTASPACIPDDTWDNGSLDDVPDPRYFHTAIWTGNVMIVWGGFSGGYDGRFLNTGGRYDPSTDTWTPTSTTNAPPGRERHTAVWTGSHMIVWGGYFGGNTGGRYDPLTDTWTATSTTDAPAARYEHTAVWTGGHMIVWGGTNGGPAFDSGGRYDPASDTWTPTSATNVPVARTGHTAVWTGSQMVVWGGYFYLSPSVTYLHTGGRYDPVTDTWTATSTTDAPAARYMHTAVWTGRHMVVWGGCASGSCLSTGGRYDPVSDTWLPTSTSGAPSARARHAAVWTERLMIIWGGSDGGGAGYDPMTDTWSSISTTNAPLDPWAPSAVWTGRLVIVWGGIDPNAVVNTGGRYDPEIDTWTPTSIADAPSGRAWHSAIWTGNRMIVWGGYPDPSGGYVNTGGRYDPVTDTWSPASTANAPSAREGHTVVWTGRHMIIWGGYDFASGTFVDSGGRYDPASDSWSATSTANAPSGRAGHTAVWAGGLMIIWGGEGASGTNVNTGARYDPVTDTWSPTSTANAPSARTAHSAVWTGSLMVIWGGHVTFENSVATGGRYDPTADTWTPTTTAGAPSPRSYQTAVWTGSIMIIWGGGCYGSCPPTSGGGRYDPANDTWMPISTESSCCGSAVWTGRYLIVWGGFASFESPIPGARYDPTSDAWTPISTTGAPLNRSGHSAVWTGSLMIVWGGTDDVAYFNTGGRYALGHSVDDDQDGFSECDGDCNDGNAAVHPGAAEVCDGLDNDCDAVADNAPVPGGIPFLTVQPSGNETLLSWSSLSQATGYDVVRGDLSILISSGGDFASATQACLADDLGGTSLSVTDAPATDGGFWYLVRPVNCGGHGSYDSGGPAQVRPRDGGINSSTSSCP